MPTLNWIGKEAVVNHHLQVPFHLLKDRKHTKQKLQKEFEEYWKGKSP